MKLANGWPEHMGYEQEDKMEYKIESGVAIPKRQEPIKQEWLDVMGKVEPGQSIFMPAVSIEEVKKIQLKSMTHGRTLSGKMFLSRTIKPKKDGDSFGLRIWRIT